MKKITALIMALACFFMASCAQQQKAVPETADAAETEKVTYQTVGGPEGFTDIGAIITAPDDAEDIFYRFADSSVSEAEYTQDGVR